MLLYLLGILYSYVDQLPLLDRPEVFGLHRNAAMAFENSETRFVFQNITSLNSAFDFLV